MSGEPQTGDRPPLVPFAVTVGVTGHRSDALAAVDSDRISERVREALKLVRDTARELHSEEGKWFAAQPARLVLVSPLADGADQMVASEALKLGFVLQSVLPFEREAYRGSLTDETARQTFDALLGQAETVLELPGQSGRELEAYVMTGRATVAHADILLAVWDGEGPRGRGGTGEVVQLALRRGTAVLHIPMDAGEPQLMWSAFDPAVLTEGDDEAVKRPFAAGHLRQLMSAVLLPPDDPQEREFLGAFALERPRKIRARVEYPLLLAAVGVARFKLSDMRERRCTEAIESEWRDYRERCVDSHGVQPALGALERAYSWSDRLATHFAQTYRSGHVFNFVLGGIAVCLGLSTFMAPRAVLEMAIAEVVITLGIIINTKVGLRNEWHRRWLDYRQLAERLRPMRSLKLLGVAAPDPPGTLANPVPRRWIDWYSARIWRAMGCPSGRIDEQAARKLAGAVAEHEIAPQVAYHQKSARQIEALDRRLERIATLLFLATLVVCVAVVIGQATDARWANDYNDWFTLVSAGFPALGTAVFGIRFQGDFGGSAIRSQATANTLHHIHDELRRSGSLARAGDLAEQAARTMLADLDEWRLINQRQDLGIA